MKVMKLAELVSTGAALTSVFHQLFGGNSGKGTGIAPPCVAAEAVTQVSIKMRATARRYDTPRVCPANIFADVRSLTRESEQRTGFLERQPRQALQ